MRIDEIPEYQRKTVGKWFGGTDETNGEEVIVAVSDAEDNEVAIYLSGERTLYVPKDWLLRELRRDGIIH